MDDKSLDHRTHFLRPEDNDESEETRKVPGKAAPTLDDRDVVEDTRPTTLIGLVIVATGYIVTIDVDEEITVGRMSNTERALHLDLTPYGANSSGVSRIRARISRTEKGITLEDLGSTNGTFLNEYRLQSFAKVPIQDGDTLELGKLRCRVKFLEKTL